MTALLAPDPVNTLPQPLRPYPFWLKGANHDDTFYVLSEHADGTQDEHGLVKQSTDFIMVFFGYVTHGNQNVPVGRFTNILDAARAVYEASLLMM